MRDIAVNVVGVKFEGIRKTRQDMLGQVMKDCLEARTFGELTRSLAAAADSLERLEVFKETKFILDTDKAVQDGVLVRVQAKERKYKVHLGTELQRNDVGLGAGGVFYNVFGRGERFDANASIGSQSATPVAISFVKPVNGNPDNLFRLSASSTLQHYINGANFKNTLRGLSASYLFNISKLGTTHELKYTLDWRHIYGIEKDASATVRRNAGHSLKSAISHTMTYSSLDAAAFPTTGVLLKLSGEVAGVGGTVRLLRHDVYSRIHAALSLIHPDVSFYLSGRIGHVMPLAGQKLALIDKYQLGGPLSVRGFALNSLGPKDKNDAIGGDFSVELGAGLSFPLSSSTKDTLRGHLFANSGVLTNIKYSQSAQQNVRDMTQMRPNISIGAGLQVKIGDAKLEFNFAHPLSMQRGAVFQRALQIGIGLEFL